MPRSISMAETLDAIYNETQGNKITIGDLVESLNSRGFGALLIAPALIAALPTGAIPGVPAICGAFIFGISLQALMGRHYPWLPKRLKKISFSREKYKQSREKVKPYIQYVDNFFHPRFEFFTNDVFQKLIALFCMCSSLIMIFIGFVPLVPVAFAIPILFFGLGLSVHDGLLTALGFLIVSTASIILPFILL